MSNNGYLGPVLVCSNKSDKTAFSFENSVCYALGFKYKDKEGNCFFIPNARGGTPRDFRFDIFLDGNFYKPVLPVVDEEMYWFRRNFTEEINKAKEWFGADNVKVEWGVLNW